MPRNSESCSENGLCTPRAFFSKLCGSQVSGRNILKGSGTWQRRNGLSKKHSFGRPFLRTRPSPLLWHTPKEGTWKAETCLLESTAPFACALTRTCFPQLFVVFDILGSTGWFSESGVLASEKPRIRFGYTVRSPSRNAFHSLLDSYFLWILAEKGTVLGPSGGRFRFTPGTCLNSTLGFAYLSLRRFPCFFVQFSLLSKDCKSDLRGWAQVSGLQKGPAERGHVKKHQKSSKSVKKFFDTFRQCSRRAKNVKNRQKCQKFFDTFRQFSRGTIFPAPFGGALNKDTSLVFWWWFFHSFFLEQEALEGQGLEASKPL